MNQNPPDNATAPRSVDQQQVCSAVARHLRPQLGGDTQRVLPTDWRLCMCVRSTGKEFLSDWGSETVMRETMAREFERNRDVWLIAPDGTKHLPNASGQAVANPLPRPHDQ